MAETCFALRSQHGQTLYGWIHSPPTDPNPKTFILLVHGYWCHCDTKLLKALASSLLVTSCRFTIPSLRPDTKTFRIASLDIDASDAIDVLSYLYYRHQMLPIGIIGHSKGALCAFHIASSIPSSLSSSLSFIVSISGRIITSSGPSIHTPDQIFYLLQDPSHYIPHRQSIKSIILSEPPSSQGALIPSPQIQSISYTGVLTASELMDLRSISVLPMITKLSQSLSIFFIHGDNDTVVPIQEGLAALPPSLRVTTHIVPGASHDYSSHLPILISIINNDLQPLLSSSSPQ